MTSTMITATAAELKAAVAWAATAVPARPVVPVLNGLRLQSDGDQATLSAFDYDQSAAATLDVIGTGPVDLLLPGVLLANLAARMPAEPVTITLDSDEAASVRIVCGATTWDLPVLPLGDYPALPGLGDPAGEVDGTRLAAAIKAVRPAVGDDPRNPAGWICAEFTDDAITLIATDTYRLAVAPLPWKLAGELPGTILLAPRALAVLAKEAPGGPVTLHLTAGIGDGAGLAGFTCGSQTLTTRLAGTEYINWRRLIDRATYPGGTITVTVEPLIKALERVDVIAGADTDVSVVRCETDPEGTIALSAAGSHDASAARETIVCDVDGDPVTIGFNLKRLREGLAGCGSETIQLRYPRDPVKPVLLTPADGDGDYEDGYRHLLMPIRISGVLAAAA
jgi:DNA polymerase-3 subunit beta